MNIAQHNTVVLDFIQRVQRRGIVPHYISTVTGELLAVLARCVQAKQVLEVGTLWGYSTWWLYQGVAHEPDAKIITIEKERKHSTLAQQFFAATQLAQVELRLGDAHSIIPEFAVNAFDFIFLDADRRDYQTLLPQLARVLRPGGLLAIDNIAIDSNHANADVMTEFLLCLEQESTLERVSVGGTTNLMLGLKQLAQ